MDLNEQVHLIREHWRLLADATETAGIPDHTLLNVLGAQLAELLAHQPERSSAEWLVEVEDHIRQLRARRQEEIGA